MTQIISTFSRNVLIASFVLSGVITNTLERSAVRAPANQADEFELTLHSISTTPASKVEHLKDAYIRVVFNDKEKVEFLKDQKFSIGPGEVKNMDLKIDLKPMWLSQDNLEFKVEIVESGFIENVRLRCSTISRGVSVYNRGYQCNVPGEINPVISYRISRKGAPLPDMSNSVAQN